MKTERAIELLHRISDSQFDGTHGDERREALEMAVRALVSQQTVNDSQGLVNDCISRKAVMKEFADFVRKSNNSDFAPTPTWNDAVSLVGSMPSAQPETHDKRTETHACDLINRQQAIDAVAKWFYDVFGITESDGTATIFKRLRELPSAQPHWIPCSKRLPEEFGEYLITKNRIGWNFEEYNSNDIAYFDNEGFHKADKVLAWMPLPEPYGGESE